MTSVLQCIKAAEGGSPVWCFSCIHVYSLRQQGVTSIMFFIDSCTEFCLNNKTKTFRNNIDDEGERKCRVDILNFITFNTFW